MRKASSISALQFLGLVRGPKSSSRFNVIRSYCDRTVSHSRKLPGLLLSLSKGIQFNYHLCFLIQALCFRTAYAIQEPRWAREAATWSEPRSGCFSTGKVAREVGAVWERYGGISCKNSRISSSIWSYEDSKHESFSSKFCRQALRIGRRRERMSGASFWWRKLRISTRMTRGHRWTTNAISFFRDGCPSKPHQTTAYRKCLANLYSFEFWCVYQCCEYLWAAGKDLRM